MPIILDTNSSENKDNQIKSIQSKLQTTKTADAKWFHDNLTGSATRSVGFFNNENHTLAQVTKNAMNKVGYPSDNRVESDELLNDELINGYSNSKPKESYFKKYARAITTPVLPSLYANYAPHNTTAYGRQAWNVLTNTKSAIELKANTPLFNLDSLDDWVTLTDSNDVITKVRPVVESYNLHSALIKSASGSSNNSYSSTGVPMIYLAVVSTKHTITDDATVHISKTPIKPTTNKLVMSLIPVDLTVSDSYLMTNYVGPYWAKIMRNLRDHYTRAGLTDLDVNVRGILDVDSEYMDLLEIISELSIIDALNDQAEHVVNNIEDIALEALDALLNYHTAHMHTALESDVSEYVVKALKIMVQLLDNFSYKDEIITTDFLNVIYQNLRNSTLSNQSTNMVVQESLRLLLSQRLHELKAVEESGGLYKFDPQDKDITKKYMNDPSFSNQQKRILTTTDPLVIGQAGAGSGKSHTLIGRIKYLEEQGEDLTKGLVLSFTNVSADNINLRFPDIRSETLANMFNQIYQNTYPAQNLSQPSTVANSLRLLNPNTKFFSSRGFKADDVRQYIDRFATTLGNLDQSGFKRVNVQEVTKDLANLIQHNMPLTETLLDAVEQTTLELQPIIIHHHLMNNHGQLNVPIEYQELQYIITDESQDISTFEYILLLELAIHHSAQLLIVGDGSQTLYEFRNSDPKYMNALESSGVFTTYKLDVNYRSSPEILTFANQFLDVIEANDIAKINLKASSFNKPTTQSFEEAVTVHNTEMTSSKPKDYGDALTRVISESNHFDKWMRNIMDKDEQVAILGWTRMEVLAVGEAIEQWLADNNYNRDVTNIMNERSRPMSVISTTLAGIHEDVLNLNPANANFNDQVYKLASNFMDYKYNRSSPAQKNFFAGEFDRAFQYTTDTQQWKVLVKDHSLGNIPKEAVIGHLNREMLRIETRKNAMDNHLLRADEAPNYDDEKIILSTIHGAKGLEFDHTIVLFNESKRNATSQEALRMFFVALSRAKKTEYIISGHTANRPAVSNNLSSMFTTPMDTAHIRALELINTP